MVNPDSEAIAAYPDSRLDSWPFATDLLTKDLPSSLIVTVIVLTGSFAIAYWYVRRKQRRGEDR
ncbi:MULTISPECIES: hypothetical protein [unclassified Devosia]|uniref:hypothetical protein n=1 Tax=unclassified Devosia TaxID=196773 RepID=UPI00086B0486|nr:MULTISPECIES: hypothetical protein [unclassified Devosia]MBN9362175.1 hypothetical protein [Devosia sp.]ODS94065.1 MAG: hypothetical protein ABS47_06790 [Devosia sp. SCN 66-27]OJX24568.1 MAG: hypothetical protein BGO83_08110 [Devosia sp. 66-14]